MRRYTIMALISLEAKKRLFIVSGSVLHSNTAHNRGVDDVPRASMPSEAKVHGHGVRRRVVGFSADRWVLAQLSKAETVELLWLPIDLGIHGDGLGRDTDGGVGRDDEAVAELPVFGDDALEGDCDMHE